jgi:uncharacterized repeat protein (TIGR03837 family)
MFQSSAVAPSLLRDRIPRWDLFCSVVDNYGDAGVAWRLARQLASEHGADVALFIDDLGALARIVPGLRADADRQSANGVEILRWFGSRVELIATNHRPADFVVEAFGCGLPAAYLVAMTERARAPVWINLEYLSAEPWIDGCHGLASRHPRLPLERYFYFPGFTAKSGGLLRERGLFADREAFRAHPDAQAALWRSLGVDPPAMDTLVVSLFCYPSRAIAWLLDAWSEGDREMICVVPEGIAAEAIYDWSEGEPPRPGAPRARGRLCIYSVPFVPQGDYDRLLWSCDVNFVRGEDSFVRAQWAALPLAWQAYPQADAAHLAKVAAFLDRYCIGLPLAATDALRAFTDAWNDPAVDPRCAASLWPAMLACRPALDAHARAWADRLAGTAAGGMDLAAGLVKFILDRV